MYNHKTNMLKDKEAQFYKNKAHILHLYNTKSQEKVKEIVRYKMTFSIVHLDYKDLIKMEEIVNFLIFRKNSLRYLL